MGSSTNMRVEATDDASLYRTARFTIGGVALKSPLKAIDITRLREAGMPVVEPTIAEVYREVKMADVRRAMSHDAGHASLQRPLRAAAKAAEGLPVCPMAVLQLDALPAPGDELAFVENLAYPITSIVSVPLVENLAKRVQGRNKAFVDYLAFVGAFLDEVKRLNHKPIFATLPPLPWALSRELAETYMSAGVDGYIIDFAGRTPSVAESQGLRQLLKRLKEEDALEKTIFYSMNANTGRAQAKRLGPGVVAAKDILAFGFSIDVLGLKHKALKGPKEMYDKMEAAGPMVRLFDRAAYAYRDVRPKQAMGVIPGTRVPPQYFAGSAAKLHDAKVIANIEQHTAEAKHLRQVIRENGIAPYLRGKSAFEAADLARFKSARDDLRRRQAPLKLDWGL